MKIKTNWMKRAMAGFAAATIAFGVSGCGQQGGEMIIEDQILFLKLRTKSTGFCRVQCREMLPRLRTRLTAI